MKKGVQLDVELTADDLKELASQFKAEYKEKIGADFPDDPKEQLMGAVKAVFRSWDNPRANVYRRDNDIPYSWGTAVNVQSMAFGNMGDDCGTGVALPVTLQQVRKGLLGEFLTNAQGEDVVAGVRTPMHISEMEQKFPEAFKAILQRFALHLKTITEICRIWNLLLNTVSSICFRPVTVREPLRLLCKDCMRFVDEGMRTPQEAVEMIDPRNLEHFFILSLMLLLSRLQHQSARVLVLLRVLLAVKSYSLLTMQLNGMQEAKRLFLFVLETSPEDITRYEGCSGYPYRSRRYDFSRCRCCSWYGYLLRFRLRRHQYGRRKQEVHTCRQKIP